MKQFEPLAFLQDLSGYVSPPQPYLIIAGAIFLTLVLFYLLRRRMAGSAIADEVPTDHAKEPASAIDDAGQRPDPVRRDRFASEKTITPRAPVVSPAASPHEEAAFSGIPQDSILRRHYGSHIRYMIETVTSPRPTDSVLRRHYDQLIASQLDACLTDGAQLQKLIRQYEEQRRRA